LNKTHLVEYFYRRIPGAGHPELVRLDGRDQPLAVYRFGGDCGGGVMVCSGQHHLFVGLKQDFALNPVNF